MENFLTRIILLSLLVARNVSPITGTCSEVRNLAYSKPCYGKIYCQEDFFDVKDVLRRWRWRCIKEEHPYYEHRTSYDYSYYRRPKYNVALNDNYTLDVYGVRFSSTDDDYFRDIIELSNKINLISVTNGNITKIPNAITQTRHAKNIDISRNSITVLNLEAFAETYVEVLNVSYNAIFNLETQDNSSTTATNNITTLDLSNNAIEAIPDSYFRSFPQLQNLNVSYNLITSVNNLTFVGLGQLRTLYISSNKISNIGQCFTNFAYLKELMLDKNYLKSIELNNFRNLSSLETLNISRNHLIDINRSFDYMPTLTNLDISNNKLTNISKSWFQHNSKIKSLDITNNVIKYIEPGAFQNTSISDLRIHTNSLIGSLERGTFQGINVKILDLSGASIFQLGPYLFDGTKNNLRTLNFSHNSISIIHKTAFHELDSLNTLDLSYNNLQNIEFDLSNLKNLSSLYINNNSIKKITRNDFKNVTALRTLDLSYNDINDIDEQSFDDLFYLESLVLVNNPLPTVIAPFMFSGLSSCTELDFTYTKVNKLCNNSFNGMNSINALNISYTDLNVLEFEVFNNTDMINALDLSHNRIEIFSINTSSITLVTTIDLRFNKLTHLTEKTFSGLNKLLFLYLEYNNIQSIATRAFRTLISLVDLKLSHNQDMSFNSSVFYNMTSLRTLYMNNVLVPFNFGNAVNTSISTLELSSCGITDIYLVFINKINTVSELSLSRNKIRSIDKFSFTSCYSLSWLDLSHNMISNIQPSSFSQCKALSDLRLNNNFLTSLAFGVFVGISRFQTLDLSNNTLHSFKGHMFENGPFVQGLYLDNNLINDINFQDLRSTKNVRKVSIGGNMIPCSALIEIKKKRSYYDFRVTAEIPKYDTENVEGVTCIGSTKVQNISRILANDTVLTLMNTIEGFKVSVERILSRNDSKVGLDMTGVKSVSSSIEHLQNAFSKSDKAHNVLIDRLAGLIKKRNSRVDRSGSGSSDLKSALYLVAACFGILIVVAVTIFLYVYNKRRWS